jgi:hypothetical protein
MGQQQRLCRDLNGRLHGIFGGMGNVADKPELMAGANYVCPEIRQAMVGQRAGLKIANVVRGVMHKLDVPNAALVRLFQPL